MTSVALTSTVIAAYRHLVAWPEAERLWTKGRLGGRRWLSLLCLGMCVTAEGACDHQPRELRSPGDQPIEVVDTDDGRTGPFRVPARDQRAVSRFESVTWQPP